MGFYSSAYNTNACFVQFVNIPVMYQSHFNNTLGQVKKFGKMQEKPHIDFTYIEPWFGLPIDC